MGVSRDRILNRTLALVAVLLVPVGVVGAEGTAEQQCQAAKNRAAGKYAACRQGAEAKLATSGDTAKYANALGKCSSKFSKAWQKAIDRAAGDGATCFDAPLAAGEIQSVLALSSDNIADALAGLGLSDCSADLAICAGDLGTCVGDLGGCTSDLMQATEDLATCNGAVTTLSGALSTCNGSLGTCAVDLASAHGSFNACSSTLTTCNSSLGNCNASLGTCTGGLETCEGDLTACEAAAALCGNGTIEEPESCDGVSLGGRTCLSLGYTRGGTLACTTSCRYDVTGCASQRMPATGQTSAYAVDKNDGVPGYASVPDDGIVRAGAVLEYVDNGDGTITDLNTGLMWEKKSDDNGLHDVHRLYSWEGLGTNETIWDWLDDVNTEGGSGFAGYADWRIPNLKELMSILDVERVSPSSPATTPLIDPVFNSNCFSGCTLAQCSCTRVGAYWTSTSDKRQPSKTRYVDFYSDDSLVRSFDKAAIGPGVRAVRGGL